MKETKRTFNDMVAEDSLDELLEATRKLCNHKLYVKDIQLPTYIDREDVMQDAMIKVFKAYKKFDPTKASANTYFTRIIENTVIDHVRHSQVYSSVQETTYEYGHEVVNIATGMITVATGFGAEASNPPRAVFKEEKLKDLILASSMEGQLFTELMMDLKDALTEREKQIFRLRYAGYTHAEIAEKLGVSRPTVAKDWLRIRELILGLID